MPMCHDKHQIPAYDAYGVSFGACDHFNKQLHKSTWPFRRGGRGVAGEMGKQHDFAMGCILLNVFNAYRSLKKVDISAYSFETYCTNLAVEIFHEFGT